MVDSSPKFSDNLILFILYSKRTDKEVTCKALATLLEPMYCADMGARDVIHHLLKAYSEFVQHGKFEIGYRHDSGRILHDLLDSPFHWHIPMFKFEDCKDNNDVQRMLYDAYASHIMGQFLSANVGWCKPELGLPEGYVIVSDELLELAKHGKVNKEQPQVTRVD